MKTYEINLTFNSLAECEKWEEENCPNRTYKGEMILFINHTEKAWNGHVSIDSITTL